MRFGIFVAMAGRRAGGPETYEHSLVRALASEGARHEFDVFCLDADARRSFALDSPNVNFRVLRSPARWLSMTALLPARLLRSPVDLLHATFVPPPVSPKRYVFTMHDTGMFAHPEFYHPRVRLRLNNLLARGVRRAASVLCVSETARALVVERFGIDPARVIAVHNGVAPHFKPLPADETAARLAAGYNLREPYALFVGQLKVRSKNIVRMLEAFAEFRRAGHAGARLVLVGRRPTHEPYSPTLIDETISRLGLCDHVTELGHVPDADLQLLYNGARAFLFPSLWEGFGLPVVEAMACGTPVITSNTSSLPEIAGDAALLVDPHSTTEIAAALARVFDDDDLCATLSAKGIARARRFTWERAARRTIRAYEAALQT